MSKRYCLDCGAPVSEQDGASPRCAPCRIARKREQRRESARRVVLRTLEQEKET